MRGETAPKVGPTRRDVLVGAIAGIAGAAGGGIAVWNYTGATAVPSATELAPTPETTPLVEPMGRTQAGIARPRTPQRAGHLLVADIDDSDPREWLAALGAEIVSATQADAAAPDGSRDLTVTVGLGPTLISSIDATLPGAEALPAFLGDDAIPAARNGGDLLLGAYATDPGVVRPTLHELVRRIPGVTIRWEQALFRSPGEGMRVRNPLGFHDGVIVPTSETELDENVWIGDGPLAGGTICVIRRLRLRADEFRGLPVAQQERIIGRSRIDGAPLTGGGPDAEVALAARTPEGDPIIDSHAHVRAAHPSFTGSHLMLRRGYAFDDGDGDAGLMFVCFQRDLRTFVATQHRLDELDALAAFSTPTASGTFLILPGFDAEHPLGSVLP